MQFTKTLEDYKHYIKGELSISLTEDNDEWSDDFITQKVNKYRRRFWRRFMYTNRKGIAYKDSVASIPSVSIPNNVDTISFVRYNDGTNKPVLRYIDWQDYARRTQTTSTGTPRYWTRIGSTAYLFPTPATGITNGVEFWGRVGVTDLAEDSDIDGNIEDDFFDLICDMATADCWAKAEQMDLANSLYAKAEKFMMDSAYEILSEQTGQDVSTDSRSPLIDETDERRRGHLT